MENLKKYIIDKNNIKINKNEIRKKRKSSQLNIKIEQNYDKFINVPKNRNKSQEISYIEEYSQNYLENKRISKNKLINKSLPNKYYRDQVKNGKDDYKKNRLSLRKLNEKITGRRHEISSINTTQIINENNEIKLKEADILINNYKKKIKEQQEKFEKLIKKNKELEEEKENIINEINKREKEFNNKISFLEDKENEIEERRKQFEKEIKNVDKNKQENNELIKQNNILKKEVDKYREKYKKLKNNIYNPGNDRKNQGNNLNRSFECGYDKPDEIINETDKSKAIKRQNSMEEVSGHYEKKPIKLYLKPTLIGLNNIGATCFMNSTLQCLSQTEDFTNYFLTIKNEDKILINNISKKDFNAPQLSPIYLDLIKKLWSKKDIKSFSPNDFMKMIEKMNPLFKTGQAGDAKDFIIFILEQIHKELKAQVTCSFFNSKQNIPLNQYDRDNAFKYFFNEFQKDCSIISDIFFGFNETTNICVNCRNINFIKGLNYYPICYNYGIFNCLIFPLEEIKNMKNSFYAYNNIQFNNRVSLDDCFSFNQKREYFTGENKNYCNICKTLCDSEYTSKIYISPNVLILILNRGKGNLYQVKLDFQESIDITQYVIKKDKAKLIYNLYGVITHIGQSGPNAHFIASCKSPVDQNWYRYNDSMVNNINDIKKEVIDFGTPYILFYQKQK